MKKFNVDEAGIDYWRDLANMLTDDSIRLQSEITRLRGDLEKASEHCLCDRSLPGFDYSEKHKRLGMPRSGARWLTPRDIIREALATLRDGKDGGV